MKQIKIGLTLLLVWLGISLNAQNLDTLREQIREAEEKIRVSNELLSKTQQNKKNTDRQLNLILGKIQNRKNIISNLDQQSVLINKDIGVKNTKVSSLQKDLSQLRKEYGAMIYDAYKNFRLNNFILFLFASRDFNDATLRIAYMRRYNRMRERKAIEIDSLSHSIHHEVSTLQTKKQELDQVRQSRNSELVALGKDETQYRSTSEELKREAGSLSSTIKSTKNKIEKLQQQIRRIIAEESRKNNAKAQASSEQREYNAKLSGQFDQNKGRLPYPVRGVIVDRFGIHPHSSIKGLQVNNTGVDIAAEKGAEVRAVFEGEVSQVFFVAGMNNAIIVRHGNYFTVYGNLVSIHVKAGDKISLNQPIGRLGDTDDDNDANLHFEIWKESESKPVNLNPESWLRR